MKATLERTIYNSLFKFSLIPMQRQNTSEIDFSTCATESRFCSIVIDSHAHKKNHFFTIKKQQLPKYIRNHPCSKSSPRKNFMSYGSTTKFHSFKFHSFKPPCCNNLSVIRVYDETRRVLVSTVSVKGSEKNRFYPWSWTMVAQSISIFPPRLALNLNLTIMPLRNSQNVVRRLISRWFLL